MEDCPARTFTQEATVSEVTCEKQVNDDYSEKEIAVIGTQAIGRYESLFYFIPPPVRWFRKGTYSLYIVLNIS